MDKSQQVIEFIFDHCKNSILDIDRDSTLAAKFEKEFGKFYIEEETDHEGWCSWIYSKLYLTENDLLLEQTYSRNNMEDEPQVYSKEEITSKPFRFMTVARAKELEKATRFFSNFNLDIKDFKVERFAMLDEHNTEHGYSYSLIQALEQLHEAKERIKEIFETI